MVLILLAQKVTNKCGKKTFEQKKTTWLKSGLKPLLVNRKHGKGAGGIGEGLGAVAELLAGQKC